MYPGVESSVVSVEFLLWSGSLEPVWVSGSLRSSSWLSGVQSLQTVTVAPAISAVSNGPSVSPQSWHESSGLELESPVEYFAIFPYMRLIYLNLCFVIGWSVVLSCIFV